MRALYGSLTQKTAVRGGAFTIHARLRPPRPQRRALCMRIQANDLNKWANLSGMDDQCDPSPFDEDTAKVLLRVLTARSVKRLLMQLQELDLVTAQWLNNYAAENSPMTGNEFIQKLFDVKGTTITDQHQGLNHTIDPQNLAHRILTIRNDMAQKATMSLPEYTSRMDAEVMRSYLTKNTFVSGTTGEGNTVANSTKRRGYYRPPPPKR